MAGPIIYYALALSGRPDDTGRIFQLLYSIISLRKYQRDLPVYLFVSGELDPLMGHFFAQQLGVTSLNCGAFGELLEAARPGSGAALSDYLLLVKYLAMIRLSELGASQALYVDSDTFFFADPARLFEQCRDADLYAREEPHSHRSPLGYSRDHLDDEALRERAAADGARYIAPFNTGVMLLNHGLWDRFAAHFPRFLDYVLRFGEQAPAALPYPAGTRWIRDQVSFWLCLGQLCDFSQADLSPAQVLMGCEELRAWRCFPRPLISHYFGRNTYIFFEKLKENPYLSSES